MAPGRDASRAFLFARLPLTGNGSSQVRGHSMTERSDLRPPFDEGVDGPDDLDLTLERAETLVARAQEVFETTVEVLRDTVRTLKAMPDTGERDVVKDVSAMNSALQMALDMQEKARVAGSAHFGGGTGGRLDLAAALIPNTLHCVWRYGRIVKENTGSATS